MADAGDSKPSGRSHSLVDVSPDGPLTVASSTEFDTATQYLCERIEAAGYDGVIHPRRRRIR
jgi:hypothetical protein